MLAAASQSSLLALCKLARFAMKDLKCNEREAENLLPWCSPSFGYGFDAFCPFPKSCRLDALCPLPQKLWTWVPENLFCKVLHSIHEDCHSSHSLAVMGFAIFIKSDHMFMADQYWCSFEMTLKCTSLSLCNAMKVIMCMSEDTGNPDWASLNFTSLTGCQQCTYATYTHIVNHPKSQKGSRGTRPEGMMEFKTKAHIPDDAKMKTSCFFSSQMSM